MQRVPVRIQLDPQQLAENPLRIGLSAAVKVNVTDSQGETLRNQAPSTKHSTILHQCAAI